MNTLKKGMLGLLLVCLCACSNDENLVAQNKPKPKTVKEMLCREWKLTRRFYPISFAYTAKDTFGITFYDNHTFEFKTDPAWYLYEDSLSALGNEEMLVIRGKWKLLYISNLYPPMPKNSEEYTCKDECNQIFPILLETNTTKNPAKNLSRLFNDYNGQVAIQYLSFDSLNINVQSAGFYPLSLKLKAKRK
jgi:hypothetical protein